MFRRTGQKLKQSAVSKVILVPVPNTVIIPDVILYSLNDPIVPKITKRSKLQLFNLPVLIRDNLQKVYAPSLPNMKQIVLKFQFSGLWSHSKSSPIFIKLGSNEREKSQPSFKHKLKVFSLNLIFLSQLHVLQILLAEKILRFTSRVKFSDL